jgi:hypothetical protein
VHQFWARRLVHGRTTEAESGRLANCHQPLGIFGRDDKQSDVYVGIDSRKVRHFDISEYNCAIWEHHINTITDIYGCVLNANTDRTHLSWDRLVGKPNLSVLSAGKEEAESCNNQEGTHNTLRTG